MSINMEEKWWKINDFCSSYLYLIEIQEFGVF